jgi:hypothetical protein
LFIYQFLFILPTEEFNFWLKNGAVRKKGVDYVQRLKLSFWDGMTKKLSVMNSYNPDFWMGYLITKTKKSCPRLGSVCGEQANLIAVLGDPSPI